MTDATTLAFWRATASDLECVGGGNCIDAAVTALRGACDALEALLPVLDSARVASAAHYSRNVGGYTGRADAQAALRAALGELAKAGGVTVPVTDVTP